MRENEVLNSKSEWGQNPIPRVYISFLDNQIRKCSLKPKIGDATGQAVGPSKRQRPPEGVEPPDSPRDARANPFGAQYKQRKKRLKLAAESMQQLGCQAPPWLEAQRSEDHPDHL